MRRNKIEYHNRIVHNSVGLLNINNRRVSINNKDYLITKGSDVIYSEFTGMIEKRLSTGVIIAELNDDTVLPLTNIDQLKNDYLVNPYFLIKSPIDKDYSEHSLIIELRKEGFITEEIEKANG